MFKILRSRNVPPQTTRIYKNVSFGHLFNSYMILNLSKYDLIIDNFDNILNVIKKIFGKNLMYWLLGHTVGKQFTGGNTINDVKKVCNDLTRQNFHIAVNYLAEYMPEFNNDEFFDSTCKRYVETFKLVDSTSDRNFFNAIKVSGMMDINLLRKMNQVQEDLENLFWKVPDVKVGPKGFYVSVDLLAEQISKIIDLPIVDIKQFISTLKLNEDYDRLYLIEWRLHSNCYNIIKPKIRESPVYKALTKYSSQEIDDTSKFIKRLTLIIDEAKKTRSYILVDAEQSYLQKAIYNIVEQLMYQYNSPEFYFIFNTVQNYTIESANIIDYEMHKVEFFGPEYPLLIKMVRGAYLDEERHISANKGYPICWSTKELTDEAYNSNSLRLLNSKAKYKKILIATHNNSSLDLIGNALTGKEKEEENNNQNKKYIHNQVYFATLLGLNDFLAYKSLGQGFNTLKYIPYGENHITLPYLIRRGKECRNLIRQSDREIKTIKEEIWARITFK